MRKLGLFRLIRFLAINIYKGVKCKHKCDALYDEDGYLSNPASLLHYNPFMFMADTSTLITILINFDD